MRTVLISSPILLVAATALADPSSCASALAFDTTTWEKEVYCIDHSIRFERASDGSRYQLVIQHADIIDRFIQGGAISRAQVNSKGEFILANVQQPEYSEAFYQEIGGIQFGIVRLPRYGTAQLIISAYHPGNPQPLHREHVFGCY